jgi:hypothetical protein
MLSKNNLIFKVLHIVVWIIFVGLSIEACALLVNFIVSIYKPEFIQNLYQKMDLTDLYNYNKWSFYKVYSLILCISFLKAVLFYIVVILMYKLDLTKPFNTYVSNTITKISYFTFSIGIISYLANDTFQKIQNKGYSTTKLDVFYNDGQAYIFMAAVIYIIAIIFKKGIELQTENDLTI